MILFPIIFWLLCAVHRSLANSDDLKQVVLGLNPLLSKDAVITFPWDARWDDLQIRGSSPRISPNYNVVVEVATEADVQTIVSLANRFNVPFLAISGGHGWTTSMNELPYGIQINMRKLNTTTLSQDGKTAIVGGGTKQYEITRSLFALGKYAVTGLSNCVSVAGPLLGGGHSLLQGQYGYSVDGLVSARVVLANSEVVEASRTKNADLFWALQGAGHNFGIVTSLEVKTYDVPSDWTVYTLIFSSEKVETLFNLINDFEDPKTDRPAKLALTGVFIRLPAVDPTNPVVLYTVAYEGSQAQAEPYAARFIALGPIFTKVDIVNYVELYTVTGNNLTGQACTPNENVLGAGVSLPAWNIQGVRKAFTIFGEYTADPRFNTSITLMENYGMQGVRAINADSTALAPEERELPILASAVIWWSGEDKETTKVAESYIHAMRDALYTGVDEDSSKKRHCYVNYASGDEPKPEIYGYNTRLEKLAKLKSEWDPENKFKYYNPIL